LNRAEELAISLGEETKKGQSRQNKLRELLSELKQKEDQHKTKIYQLQSEYTEMVSELKNEIDTREVTIQKLEEKLSITFVDRILFDKGKSTVSPQGRRVLNKVGTVLKNVQNRKIRVIGHTDNIPIERKYQHIFPTNWELSAARAAAVVRYFQYKIGLDPINLEVVGRSFYDAVAGNDTQEERSKNRRVNIVIAPKLE
jgi:chemotaxis protein MotB